MRTRKFKRMLQRDLTLGVALVANNELVSDIRHEVAHPHETSYLP